jgi:cell division protein FtsZ
MAAQNAIANPLLDEVSLKGAKAVLVNVTGGPDMTLLEVDEACNAISSEVDPDANTIFGAAFDDSLQGQIRVSVVATGMDGSSLSMVEPRPIRVSTAPPRAAEAPRAPEPVAEPAPVFAEVEPEPEPILEPVIAVAADAETVIKIVDPAVVEDDDDFALPLVAAAPASAPAPAAGLRAVKEPAEERAPEGLVMPSRRPQQKAGWLSLFGGRRYEPQEDESPMPQFRNKHAVTEVRSTGSAQPVEEAEPEDDLEIPSFLRRLAN